MPDHLRQSLLTGGSEPVNAKRLHRKADPETSRWAAEQIDGCNELQRIILGVLNGSPKGLTDEKLCSIVRSAHHAHSESSIRSRRSELADKGLVRWDGKHSQTASGRKARVWVRVR